MDSRSGDTVAGFVLLLLSLGGMFYSICLERPAGWSTAPGLLPFIISALLCALAITMIVGSLRGKGRSSMFKRPRTDGILAAAKMFSTFRPTLTVMAIVAVFFFGLLEFLWFEIAAFGFLYAMTHMFWPGSTRLHRLAFASVTPLAFVLVFQLLFDFSLPGAGTLTEFALFERH